MSGSRDDTLRRWLLGPDKSPPLPDRLALFAGGLVAAGGVYAATNSEGLQLLVLIGLVLVVYPLVTRVNPRSKRDELTDVARTRHPPFRVLALSLVGLASWMALEHFLPDFGLGPWFWFWAVLVPWLELYRFLAQRDLRRHGLGT